MKLLRNILMRFSLSVGLTLLFLLVVTLIGGLSAIAASPKILINEFYRGGTLNTGDEWIEVLLIEDLTASELNGFYVGDSTSSTTAKYSGYQFTNMGTIASSFPKGTIIVIGGDTALTENTSYDPSSGDWNILLRTSGSHLTSNGNSGNLAGTDVAYVDTDGTNGNTTISADGFAVNWDSTPGTLGGNANVTISGVSNNTGSVLTSDLAGASTSGNWSTGVAAGSLTMGQPNGGNNATYINDLRTPTASGLTIIKTADPTTVAYNGAVTYTISLSSTAAFSDTGAMMTDTLPLSATFSHWVISPTGTIRNGDAITWTGEITTSELITFTFVATHTGGYDEVITNTAYFSGTSITATDSATFTVLSATPNLSVGKTGAASVIAGENIVYTLTVRNTGGANASGVILTDTLPLSVTYLSDNSGWTAITSTVGSNEAVRWVTSTLATDASHTFNLTATVSASVTNGAVITNTAIITSASSGDDPANNSDQWESVVVSTVSIYDIQYVPDPATNDASPYENQLVIVEGIVTANSNDFGGDRYFIEDPAGGPWSGLYIYHGGDRDPVQEGDYVHLYGEIIEYYGLTELDLRNSAGGQQSILSSGNPLPATEVLTTGTYVTADPNAAEPYEGVLIEFQSATVTDDNLGNGEWAFDDGTGATRADDLSSSMTYSPANGDKYSYIRGLGYYSYSNYKLAPRYDADIAIKKDTPEISKTAPVSVTAGSLFTYTITLKNQLGYPLTGVVLTDTVPTSVTFASASGSGVMANGVVSWTIGLLTNTETVSRTFQVTATGQSGTTIVNSDYAVQAANFATVTFGSAITSVVPYIGACDAPYIPIYIIQGSSGSSSMDGQIVTIEGVVVGGYQGTDQFNGFAIQDATGDGNSNTSDGIFVYAPSSSNPVLLEGNIALVTGEVDEFFGLTEITNVSAITTCGTSSITATEVMMPFNAGDDMEAYEGMLVSFPQTLHVTEIYNLARYGQVMLSSGGRLMNPTNVVTPGQPANDMQAANDLNFIYLDDTFSNQNPDPLMHPLPGGLSASNTLRGGYTIADMTGVVYYSYGDYLIEPVSSPSAIFTATNARSAAPEDVGGSLKVAAFNVLNYFTTFGSRGADNQFEFDRQRNKIITAVLALDADVIGLMEIENNGYTATGAIQDLVDGLNANASPGTTYAFVDPGTSVLGSDEIAVGLLYKTETVSLLGSAATTDTGTFATKNRQPLAATFEQNSNGARFTAVVNHLKSKGSNCDALGDPDTGDGQGNCNLTRTSAAITLTNWLATDPTNSGDPDFLIIGDLNAYAKEDPITALTDRGYTDLVDAFGGANAYSYVYSGQWGYLDYSLANSSLLPQVVSATVWYINSDEPRALDYNEEYKSAGQVISFYAPDAYRASDHDPVIVGLNLIPPQPNLSISKSVDGFVSGTLGTINLPTGSVVTYTISLANSGDAAAAGVVMTDEIPSGVTFGGFVQQGSAMLPAADTITWGPYDIPVGENYDIVFTATVNSGTEGQIISNTAWYTSGNGGGGSDSASFSVAPGAVITYGVTITTPMAALSGNAGTTVTYTLRVSNTGNAVDTFNISVSGNVWVVPALLPVGPLSAGAGASIDVTVTIPASAANNDMDTATITATSQGNGSVSDSVGLTTTAVVPTIYLPLVMKN